MTSTSSSTACWRASFGSRAVSESSHFWIALTSLGLFSERISLTRSQNEVGIGLFTIWSCASTRWRIASLLSCATLLISRFGHRVSRATRRVMRNFTGVPSGL